MERKCGQGWLGTRSRGPTATAATRWRWWSFSPPAGWRGGRDGNAGAKPYTEATLMVLHGNSPGRRWATHKSCFAQRESPACAAPHLAWGIALAAAALSTGSRASPVTADIGWPFTLPVESRRGKATGQGATINGFHEKPIRTLFAPCFSIRVRARIGRAARRAVLEPNPGELGARPARWGGEADGWPASPTRPFETAVTGRKSAWADQWASPRLLWASFSQQFHL